MKYGIQLEQRYPTSAKMEEQRVRQPPTDINGYKFECCGRRWNVDSLFINSYLGLNKI